MDNKPLLASGKGGNVYVYSNRLQHFLYLPPDMRTIMMKEEHAETDHETYYERKYRFLHELIANMKKGTDKQLCWHFIVSDESEIENLETLDIPADAM